MPSQDDNICKVPSALIMPVATGSDVSTLQRLLCVTLKHSACVNSINAGLNTVRLHSHSSVAFL